MPLSAARLRERSTIDDWSGLPVDLAKRITPEPNTGCWLWLGSDAGSKAPYPTMTIAGRHTYIHRYAYTFVVGPILPGLTLDHRCRQTMCVNPGHLEAVTMAENIRRGHSKTMVASKRNACLLGHPLTPQKNGTRVCLICKRARWHRYYWRDPVAAAAKALISEPIGCREQRRARLTQV